ncbi:hypothetical protein PAHAL_2G401200 [Panicum hallii]|jgi:hypothetical protein|uniref:Uncharacterized protein n=1 Tax=Panicum hallii TaxID=206008 RepID=A0A2S3H2Z1_9POAL|nr:hypothetical protein PAHAL_2G401200 [Panicum hallii]
MQIFRSRLLIAIQIRGLFIKLEGKLQIFRSRLLIAIQGAISNIRIAVGICNHQELFCKTLGARADGIRQRCAATSRPPGTSPPPLALPACVPRFPPSCSRSQLLPPVRRALPSRGLVSRGRGEAPAAAPAVARADDLVSKAHQSFDTVRVGSMKPIARRALSSRGHVSRGCGKAPAAAPAVACAADLASTAHQRFETIRVGSMEPIACRGPDVTPVRGRRWRWLATSVLLRRSVPLSEVPIFLRPLHDANGIQFSCKSLNFNCD